MGDRLQALKYALITVALIAGWFALASISHRMLVELLLGWIGLGGIVLYWRWLLRNKLRPPKA
jgi:hypothetical protein